MKEINKFFNLVSSISCIIMIIFIYLFMIMTKNFYLNGYIFLIFLCMLLNPIKNIFRLKKKIITNPIYHLIVTGISMYTSYIALSSILIYNKYLNGKDNFEAMNRSIDYFGNSFIYIAIAIIIALLLSFIFKKKIIVSNKDNSKLLLSIIFVTALLPIISGSTSEMGLISKASNIAELIFVVIIFLKLQGINTTSDLQKAYLSLMALSILSLNPIALVISTYNFIQLDTFGLHI